MGTGVRVMATEKIATQGNTITTENALDLSIAGDGYFQIAQPDGTIAYTRDGNFNLDNAGQLVTSQGQLLQPAIVIPPNASSITIGQDGTVSIELQAGGGQQILGQRG
ncbi:MAG: flagellar hook-basal body complex protein [Betaproteobacteria bacterium]|nr:flagellar hook-basal body complex protein [Candidatus Fonsibacter lacus]